MTKRQLIRQNEKLRRKYEDAFYPKVKRALKNYISSFTSVLEMQGVQATQRALSENLVAEGLAPVIRELYVKCGLEKANISLSALRKLPKVQQKRRSLGFNAEWTAAILEYFSLHLFDLVVLPISETTRNHIQLILNLGIEEGWSIERMVQEIEREDYLDGRVRRILRTESNRAINYGGELAREKFEYVTQKKWVAVHDNRTRHAHLSADGQTVASDGFFTVGGETMQFPGDPQASGANTINCRCFVEDVAVRDEKGRLVPKGEPKPPVRIRGRLRRELQSILNELQ